MGKILLINPVGEGRYKKRRAKRKSGAAKRATSKTKPKPVKKVKPMAKAKRRKAKRKTAKRSTSPVRTITVRRSTRKGVQLTARGKRRAAKNRASHKAHYYPNPIRRARRRNPIGGLPSVNHIKNNLVMPALTGAAGAIVLDAAWANLPIPANMKTGYVGHGVKLLGAVLVSTLASKVVSKQAAENMGVGMITVQAYNMMRQFLGANVPGLKLAGDDMGWIEAGYPVGDQVSEYVSEYVSGDDMGGEFGEDVSGDDIAVGEGEFSY